jgi:hypothetical protein
MHAGGVFTTAVFKRPTPQSLFYLIILTVILATSLAIPGFVLAQGPKGHSFSERAPGNSPLNEDKEPIIEHVFSEIEVPGELIVKFQKGIGRQKRQEALSRVASRMRHFEDRNTGKGNRRGPDVFDQLVHVQLKAGIAPQEVIADLERDPRVEYAEPNLFVHTFETFPNDPDFNLLWGLYNSGQSSGAPGADIDVASAWDTGTGSAEVVVAVIDTGVDYTHPDLTANMWVNAAEIPQNGVDDDGNGFVDDIYGYDVYNDDPDPDDDHFHGTHCAGTIGAKGSNGIGVAGVNWTVRLMAVKFLSASGSGDTAGAVSAIQYAINNGAHVMSNSWGGSGRSQALQDIILEAYNAGIVFVAAAGNNGSDSTVYPAAYEKVIAVSATDHNDVKAGFSSYGTFIDVAAPGVNIFSTKLDGTYGYASGTSMACPHVAGLAALIKSKDSTLTPDQVEYILETSADDLGDAGWDTFYGSGRINASWALEAVKQNETRFPTAQIASPADGQVVSGVSLDISGTAAGDGFVDYSIQYAAAGSDTWSLIAQSSSAVSTGLLASWDTGRIEDGDYVLLLTVTDSMNRKIYDAVTVTVDSYETDISFPTQLVSMETVEILGSAATKNGMPFDSYTLEWGAGSVPTSFSTAGITLANGGLQPATSGSLATWDTSGLADGKIYTLRLTVKSALGVTAQTSVKTKADTDLVKGWPVPLSDGTYTIVVPTVADLDGDGSQEIITAGPDEQIRVYRRDATPFPGFPVRLNAGDSFRWGVNVDDLDADGTREIIAVAYNSSASPQTRVIILKHDGSFYPGWPTPGLARAVSKSDLTPAVADLNADGTAEIVLIEVSTRVSGTYVRLHAFGLDGTELAGFPIEVILPPVGFDPGELFPSKHSAPSVADLDGDGHPEIAFSFSNRIYLFDHQGNVLSGWPFIAPDDNGKSMLFENAAASGDIDGDGRLELFSVGRARNCGGCETQLYGWRRDGTVLPGWPRTDLDDNIVLWNTNSVQNTPVLADINGDGKDEVIVGLNDIAVFGAGGRMPFGNSTVWTDTQPSASDVDGDGRLEFAVNGYGGIGLVDDDGSYYWRKSMLSGGVRNTAGVLADLDGDGVMEMVLCFADRNNRLGLFVWQIPRPGAGPAREEWRMFNHDPARSGRNGFTVIDPPKDNVPPVSTIEAPADGSTVSGINTVVINASDNVAVTRVEIYLDGVLLATDISKPYGIAWDTTTVSNGSHTLQTRAYDAAGNAGSSPENTVTVSNDTTEPCTPGAPTVSLAPAIQSADAGTALQYSVSVTNTDSATCPESTFSLGLIIPGGWSSALASNSLTLLPGQTGQPSLAVSSAADAAPGSYSVSVTISDTTESAHDGSANAAYTVLASVGDSEPPSAPTGLSADLKLKHVNLSWNASTDNVGVAAYQIRCNGNLVGETTVNSYTDRSISPGGSFTYHVVAFDAAGNASGPSNSLTLDFMGKANQGKGKGKPK